MSAAPAPKSSRQNGTPSERSITAVRPASSSDSISAVSVISAISRPALRAALAASKDADYQVPWSLKHGDRVLMTLPRGAVVRQTINHLVHHRGQLTVYLRLLEVPVPSIYGPTADEGMPGF